MVDADPSIDGSPFVRGFLYNPYSPMVHGMERRNTLHAVRSPLHPALMARLQVELHIPPDRDIHVFEQWCPLGREGYFYDLVGTYRIPSDPTRAPWFWLYSLATNVGGMYTTRWDDMQGPSDQQPLLAWRRRVRFQDHQFWVEARWSPQTGEILVMKGPEKDIPLTRANVAFLKAHMPKIYEGVALLKAIKAATGRPPAMDEATFRRLYPETYWKLHDQAYRDGNRLPNKTEVAADMLISPKTLKRKLDRYRLPFPPLPPQ
jgi:hypothetical protein